MSSEHSKLYLIYSIHVRWCISVSGIEAALDADSLPVPVTLFVSITVSVLVWVITVVSAGIQMYVANIEDVSLVNCLSHSFSISYVVQ